MTKKSPGDLHRHINHMKKMSRKRALKPPYECPICCGTEHMRKPVYTKVKKIPKEFRIEIKVWCALGCFIHVFKRECGYHPVFQPIDAYSEAIDLVMQGKIGVTRKMTIETVMVK